MQDNGSVSPSKSIVQLYELEYERMKMRCARAEAALGESYRSLDTLNDLIVATDTSKQLASSTSVNALLDFFQQVSFIGVCFFFFFFYNTAILYPLTSCSSAFYCCCCCCCYCLFVCLCSTVASCM